MTFNPDVIMTLLISGCVFGVLNVVLLAVVFFMRRKVNEVKNWPSVGGVVISSHIEYRASSEGGDTPYPVVLYAYQIGQQTYQANKIAPGPEVGGWGADKTVAKYAPNRMVTVYYNPQNPSEAVLEKNAPAEWVIWLILAIFDAVLCCIVPVTIFFFGV